jgi:hypothetical protein
VIAWNDDDTTSQIGADLVSVAESGDIATRTDGPYVAREDREIDVAAERGEIGTEVERVDLGPWLARASARISICTSLKKRILTIVSTVRRLSGIALQGLFTRCRRSRWVSKRGCSLTSGHRPVSPYGVDTGQA